MTGSHLPGIFCIIRDACLRGSSYFTWTEEALAEMTFKYFHQQTMRLSESQLISRLTSVDPNIHATQAFSVVSVVLDFQKWNLHFCHENADGTFKWLDQLYGWEQLFRFTRDFFEPNTMYLSSHSYHDSALSKGHS